MAVLLEEAVVDKMYAFVSQLQKHFDYLMANGREVALEVHVFDNGLSLIHICGNSYYFRADYPNALEFFRKSLLLARSYPDIDVYKRQMNVPSRLSKRLSLLLHRCVLACPMQ